MNFFWCNLETWNSLILSSLLDDHLQIGLAHAQRKAQTIKLEAPKNHATIGHLEFFRITSFSMTTFGSGCYHATPIHSRIDSTRSNKSSPIKDSNNFQHHHNPVWRNTRTLMTYFTSLHMIIVSKLIHQPFKDVSKPCFLPKLTQTPPWMGSAQRHAPNWQCSDESRPQEISAKVLGFREGKRMMYKKWWAYCLDMFVCCCCC